MAVSLADLPYACMDNGYPVSNDEAFKLKQTS